MVPLIALGPSLRWRHFRLASCRRWCLTHAFPHGPSHGRSIYLELMSTQSAFLLTTMIMFGLASGTNDPMALTGTVNKYDGRTGALYYLNSRTRDVDNKLR